MVSGPKPQPRDKEVLDPFTVLHNLRFSLQRISQRTGGASVWMFWSLLKRTGFKSQAGTWRRPVRAAPGPPPAAAHRRRYLQTDARSRLFDQSCFNKSSWLDANVRFCMWKDATTEGLVLIRPKLINGRFKLPPYYCRETPEVQGFKSRLISTLLLLFLLRANEWIHYSVDSFSSSKLKWQQLKSPNFLPPPPFFIPSHSPSHIWPSEIFMHVFSLSLPPTSSLARCYMRISDIEIKDSTEPQCWLRMQLLISAHQQFCILTWFVNWPRQTLKKRS